MYITARGLVLAAVVLLAAPGAVFAEHEFFTRSDVKNVVEQIERHGDEFERVFDSGVGKLDLQNASRYKDWADDLEKAVDDLKEEYKEKDFAKARAILDEAMLVAAPLNRLMLREPFNTEAQRAWSVLRDDLNTLAASAGIPALPNLFVTVSRVQ